MRSCCFEGEAGKWNRQAEPGTHAGHCHYILTFEMQQLSGISCPNVESRVTRPERPSWCTRAQCIIIPVLAGSCQRETLYITAQVNIHNMHMHTRATPGPNRHAITISRSSSMPRHTKCDFLLFLVNTCCRRMRNTTSPERVITTPS